MALSSKQLAEMMAAAKKAEKEAEESEKGKAKSRQALADFEAAASVYDKDVYLHTGPTPRYFTISKHWDEDPKTKVRKNITQLTFFSDSKLYPTYAELSEPKARVFLRSMIEGGDIEIPGTSEVQYFEPKKYIRLANTVSETDKDTFNLLRLTGKMVPSGRVVKDCPEIIKALLISLSGSKRVWEQDHWELTKQENYDWLEKWIYGVVCADIGNTTIGTPVIFGSGKVGKNALADRVIAGILGNEACYTATWDIIDGNFNSYRYGKVFTFIDEVPSRDDWARFKNMTGSPSIVVNEKYAPAVTVDNCIVYMIGSNEDTYPLPLEDGKQMVRMSPIKAAKDNTFAEVTLQVMTRPLIVEALEGLSVSTNGMSDYELGDTFLKHFASEWYGKEALQEFLDYLHTKYGKEPYQLQPLRGNDWIDILRSKPDPINELAEYITIRSPDVITEDEVYEIYTVMTGTMRSRNYQKLQTTVINNLKTIMEATGYTLVDKVGINLSGGGGKATMIKVFKKPNAKLENLKNDYEKYIQEELVGSKAVKRLIYENNVVKKDGPAAKISKFKI